jgi:hypothetical protein
MSPTQIVQKLWNYCNVLQDDGMSYGDYVEQLTYLLFFKDGSYAFPECKAFHSIYFFAGAALK